MHFFQYSGTESLERGIFIDPCTPKGYSHIGASWKLSPGSLSEKDRFLSALHSRGNFSECRSAALMLLQRGKGCNFFKKYYCIMTFSVVGFLFISFLVVVIIALLYEMQRNAPISSAT